MAKRNHGYVPWLDDDPETDWRDHGPTPSTKAGGQTVFHTLDVMGPPDRPGPCGACAYLGEPCAFHQCECPPCPGRGNDGHGLTHCAECCFGTGVEAELDCPVHGMPAPR